MANRQKRSAGHSASTHRTRITVDAAAAISGAGDCAPQLLITGNDTDFLEGHCAHFEVAPAFHVHCLDAVELQSAASTGRLSDCLCINLILRGRIEFCLGSRRYRLETTPGAPATCAALATDRPLQLTRYTRPQARVTKIHLAVGRQWLAQRCGSQVDRHRLATVFSQGPVVRRWQADIALAQAAQQVLDLSRSSDLERRIDLEASLYGLLKLCLRDALTTPLVDVPLAPTRADTEWQLLQHIEHQLPGAVKLAQLASDLGMSVSTLQRRFKARHGVTVMDYVRRRRLQAARAALLAGGINIREAARRAGYNHASNFIAAFKREFGCTPRLLLKRHRQHAEPQR